MKPKTYKRSNINKKARVCKRGSATQAIGKIEKIKARPIKREVKGKTHPRYYWRQIEPRNVHG